MVKKTIKSYIFRNLHSKRMLGYMGFSIADSHELIGCNAPSKLWTGRVANQIQ
jgi:hypothetical protein